jgi:hypothetical protein
MSSATKPSRIMDILAKETGGHSYKSHKYSLDESARSSVEYGEANLSIQKQETSRYRLKYWRSENARATENH